MASKAVVLLASLLGAAPVMARADSANFDIPAQPLAAALKVFAEQAQVQLLYQSSAVNHARAPAISGELDKRTALEQLLKGTDLEAVYSSDVAVTIRPARQTSQSHVSDTDEKEGTKSSSGEFRVAQVDQGANSQSVPIGRNSTSQAASNDVRLEEILVTAQKRPEYLKDVPISIAALGADELQKRNIISIDDLSLVVPGIGGLASSGYNRQIFLRGVGNLAGNSSLVGLYIDDANVTNLPAWLQPDIRTYDLERVEVLKGPQGTLYGEGSVGGTIRFITKDPRLDHLDAATDIAALYTETGAPSQRIQTMINVPLLDNQLGLRVAGTFDHEGGWMDEPAANIKDFNSENVLDVRAKLLWQPSSQLRVIAMALVHRNATAPDVGEDSHGNYTQQFGFTTTPNSTDNHDLYSITLNYDFSGARLVSATNYFDKDQKVHNEGGGYQETPPGTEPFGFYYTQLEHRQSNFNEELRLVSTGSGPWQWTIGGQYRHANYIDKYPIGYYFVQAGQPGAPPDPFNVSPYEDHGVSNSEAVFGDTSYQITDALTLGAGLRYYQDDQDYGNLFSTNPDQSAKFHATSPRAYAQYKLTQQANIYASASKGFRSGGFNGFGQPQFGPEIVWTYEFGSKMSLDEGRISFNPALFYSRYSNYQINGLDLAISAFNITSNGGDATIKGADWTLDWRPTDQWTFSFNGNYLKTEFTKINLANTAYNVGDNLDFIPKYEFTVSAERNFACAEQKSCFARLDYSQQGRSTYRGRNIGPWYFSESDIIHNLGLHLGMQWSENLTMGFLIQNLLNDRGYVSADVIDGYAARNRPRTYGVNFSAKL